MWFGRGTARIGSILFQRIFNPLGRAAIDRILNIQQNVLILACLASQIIQLLIRALSPRHGIRTRNPQLLTLPTDGRIPATLGLALATRLTRPGHPPTLPRGRIGRLAGNRNLAVTAGLAHRQLEGMELWPLQTLWLGDGCLACGRGGSWQSWRGGRVRSGEDVVIVVCGREGIFVWERHVQSLVSNPPIL